MDSIYDFESKIDELITVQREKFKGILEEYLRSILVNVESYKDNSMDLDLIYKILKDSFDTQQAEFKEEWFKYIQSPNVDDIQNEYKYFLKPWYFKLQT